VLLASNCHIGLFPAKTAGPYNPDVVILPAAKLPDASRATTLDTVLASVASTANVLAVDPLNVPPEVKYVPAVSAAVVAFAVVAVVALVAHDAVPVSAPTNVVAYNVPSPLSRIGVVAK